MINSGAYNQHFKKIKRNVSQSEANHSSTSPKTLSIEQLRKNVAKKNKKPKRKFPLVQFVVFMVCAGGLFFAIESYDKLETYLQKIEIGIGLAQAETTSDNHAAAAEHKTEDKKEAVSEENKTVSEEKNKESEALDQLYKLTERKKELDSREEELNKKAKEIENQKVYVEQKLKELEDYRQKISNLLQDRVKADAGKVDNLVQIYTNMRPGQAAKVFETMDEDLVIEILSKMKKKTAADVLNLMKAEKAQLFAERYAGYRLPAALAKPESTVNNKDSKKEDATETQKP